METNWSFKYEILDLIGPLGKNHSFSCPLGLLKFQKNQAKVSALEIAS